MMSIRSDTLFVPILTLHWYIYNTRIQIHRKQLTNDFGWNRIVRIIIRGILYRVIDIKSVHFLIWFFGRRTFEKRNINGYYDGVVGGFWARGLRFFFFFFKLFSMEIYVFLPPPPNNFVYRRGIFFDFRTFQTYRVRRYSLSPKTGLWPRRVVFARKIRTAFFRSVSYRQTFDHRRPGLKAKSIKIWSVSSFQRRMLDYELAAPFNISLTLGTCELILHVRWPL